MAARYDILNDLNLTDEEWKYVKEYAVQPAMLLSDKNQLETILEFYHLKKTGEMVDALIVSNEKLSESNEKYSERMVNLTKALVIVTGGLCLVGIAQIILTIFG